MYFRSNVLKKRKKIAIRITVNHKSRQHLQISLLNYLGHEEFKGHFFVDDFGNKHARLLRHLYHFEQIFTIHQELSQREEILWLLRVFNLPSISQAYIAEYLAKGVMLLVFCHCQLQIFACPLIVFCRLLGGLFSFELALHSRLQPTARD